MDLEDRGRALSNKAKVLRFLQEQRVVTNEQLRRIGGSRAMARVHELQKAGEPITVRKLHGPLWEVRYDTPALGRDAGTRVPQKALFDLSQRG